MYLCMEKVEGPVNVEAVFEINSHSEFHHNHRENLVYTFSDHDTYGITDFINANDLIMHFVEGGFITLRAKIAINL
jgi:hypothetical protein